MEYLIVLPIEDLSRAEYKSGEKLPLHCTLMDWFSLGVGRTTINLELHLRRIAREVDAIELQSDHPDLFGPEGTPGYVLLRNEALLQLHTNLLMLLTRMECVPKMLQWVGAGYRPHVSNVGCRSFGRGARHTATRMILIERDTKTRVKHILNQYLFGKN